MESSTQFLKLLFWRPFEYLFLNPYEEPFWVYWFSCTLVASLVYCVRYGVRTGLSELRQDFVPRGEEGRRVVRTDLIFFGVNFFVLVIAMAPIVAFTTGSTAIVHDFLIEHFGHMHIQLHGLVLDIVIIVLSLLAFLVGDLAFTLVHLAFHKIPVLWEFHKVHHAPKDLWFLTNYRGHPVNLLAYRIGEGVLIGVVIGGLSYLFDLSAKTEINADIIAIVGAAAGGMFRHTRVWLHFGQSRFGRIMNTIISTPAHHQMHHSTLSENWDRNFGALFSIWDWMFGTLVLPGAKARLEFGIVRSEGEREYDYTLYSMFFDPFSGAWDILSGRRRPEPPDIVQSAPPVH